MLLRCCVAKFLCRFVAKLHLLLYLCIATFTKSRFMARIISVINDKGGVSKTTTVFNLGTALWLLGYKVLLVDNDHQCNLTLDMDKTAQNTEPNLLTWMKDGKSDIPVYTRYDGLDYIPSSSNLEELSVFLGSVVGSDRYLSIRLHALLKQDNYDFVLIDCGPGGGNIINVNALEASDEVLIPVRTDAFSVKGRGILERRIQEVQQLGYDLKVLGILLTQFDARREMARLTKDYFSEYSRENPDMPLIPTQIHLCEAINKAHGTQMSIFEFDATSQGADDYMRLAEWVATGSFARKKSWTPATWAKKSLAAFQEFEATQQD